MAAWDSWFLEGSYGNEASTYKRINFVRPGPRCFAVGSSKVTHGSWRIFPVLISA